MEKWWEFSTKYINIQIVYERMHKIVVYSSYKGEKCNTNNIHICIIGFHQTNKLFREVKGEKEKRSSSTKQEKSSSYLCHFLYFNLDYIVSI